MANVKRLSRWTKYRQLAPLRQPSVNLPLRVGGGLVKNLHEKAGRDEAAHSRLRLPRCLESSDAMRDAPTIRIRKGRAVKARAFAADLVQVLAVPLRPERFPPFWFFAFPASPKIPAIKLLEMLVPLILIQPRSEPKPWKLSYAPMLFPTIEMSLETRPEQLKSCCHLGFGTSVKQPPPARCHSVSVQPRFSPPPFVK